MFKLITFNFSLVFSAISFCYAQSSKNCILLDNWNSDTLLTNSTNVRYSGCSGFVQNGQEYAVIGSTEGHHIFQLTDQNNFQFIDFIQARYVSSQAITREYKIFKNYLYASGDEGNGSLQIIDVSYLPDSVSLVADIQNSTIGKIHNLFIDTTNELLFACSVTPVVNGQDLSMVPLKVFSLANPLNPTIVWEGPEDLNEVHDIFVRDQLAILNCGYDGIRVYDFSIPNSPVYKSNLSFYQDQGYNHQGWLCSDGKTYIFADETAGTKIKKATFNEDFSLTVNSLFATENEPYLKTPHNIQATNEFAFVAYYNDGLRIFDLRMSPPQEIAFFDTHQDEVGNTFSMWGAWGVYTFLPSERILVSDRNAGLFMFQFDRELFKTIGLNKEPVIFPNPCNQSDFAQIFIPNSFKDPKMIICDSFGKIVENIEEINSNFVTLKNSTVSGVYYVKISYLDDFNEEQISFTKFIIR